MSEKQHLENLLADDSFIRWIKDRASDKQREYWSSWMRGNPDHRHLVEQAKELIELTGPDKMAVPNRETELEKLEASFRRIDLRRGKIPLSGIRKAGGRPKKFFGAVAAGLIILIISVSFFLIYINGDTGNETSKSIVSKHHEFRTGYGEKISLKLSDGSLIILNANSHLNYTSTLQTGQNIDVWLEGEAYFDISHHEGENRRFFTVHTKDGSVEVLGTTFTVKTSADGTRAVLEEGEIEIKVDTEDGSQVSGTEFVMKPGELIQFRLGSKKVELQKVNPLVYTSWTQNRWVFEDTPLTEVARRMEENFGVEVEIRAKELQDRILSGSIKSTNLEILKGALSEALRVPVTQENNTVVIGKEN